jgi:hypothetical protein
MSGLTMMKRRAAGRCTDRRETVRRALGLPIEECLLPLSGFTD